jgi:hypothetical protein
LTATTTNEMQNMMCAMVTAVRPAGRPIMRNRVSRLEPMTTSGVAIGMKMSRLVADRALNRYRPRANAMAVPSMVATTEAISPICSDRLSDSQMPCAPHGFSQASVENSCHV